MSKIKTKKSEISAFLFIFTNFKSQIFVKIKGRGNISFAGTNVYVPCRITLNPRGDRW